MSVNNKPPTPEENRRLIIAFVLSMAVLAVYFVFYQQPKMAAQRAQQQVAAEQQVPDPKIVTGAPKEDVQSVEEALSNRPSITIATKRVHGSIALKGLRLDDLTLSQFHDHIDSTNPVRLLAPSGTREAYFVEQGMMANKDVAVPGTDTVWKISGANSTLSVNKPVTVQWNNGQGLVFRRTFNIDANYLITVEQDIINNGSTDVTLYPYALISQSHHVARKGEHVPFEDKPSAVMHTGGIAYLNEELVEESYGDLKDEEEPFTYGNVKGWLGLTTKYWLVALLPDPSASFDARLTHQPGTSKDHDIFQADLRGQAVIVKAGEQGTITQSFFAGAKQLNLLNAYEKDLGVAHLDLAIDFGWLYFLTKPLYRLLHWLGEFFADKNYAMSFALALLTMTVIVRLATFPLANKAFRSMAKMKQVGPQMQLLKEQHGKDKERFQKEIIALYKREKVNPASGCIPMLIQIPIFFALYKVLYVSIDMRHQPFWGWIQDMAAPDTTSVFNLFGLVPWNPPQILMLGAWPLLYGLTLWLQQKMQPTPEDPIQKQMMAMFPFLFMFLFAQFPAGLVIYYVWSNLLGIVQQYIIKRQVDESGLVVMKVDKPKKPRGKKAKDMPTIVVPDNDA